VEGPVGSYNWRQLDAVLNVPIVQDKVALRLAGQFIRRDGYTKIASIPGLRTDRQMVDNYRISLLIEPVEGLRNVTVYDFNGNYRALSTSVLYKTFPGTRIG
jgi:iron complex outermembrane receptor protein